jgi:hypothetical protein
VWSALYICYADESGCTGLEFDKNQPHFVMVGILANTYSLHRTQSDFGEITDTFRQLTGKDFQEVKADQLYAGRGPWAVVTGERRHPAYRSVLEWLVRRKHDVIFSAIDTRVFFERLAADTRLPSLLPAPYIAAALHIALAVQRRNQGQEKNKERTLLIYDQQEQFDKRISELISRPADWTDPYYGYKSGDRLGQIIDTAYFVRSHHASLIQVADLIAFVFRRHAEINDGGDPERFSGERAQIQSWVNIVKPRLIESRHMLPPVSDELVQLYSDLCPRPLKELVVGGIKAKRVVRPS